jgi:hypothetical protein
MATDVPLRCECGKVRGTAKAVSRSSGTRCVCYCTDCQAFARFLGREGIMDRWGGSDIWQMSPAHLTMEIEGAALACVRLSDEGMHRWYCRECKTPIANTMNGKMAFVGLIQPFMDHASSGIGRDELLGDAKPIQTKTAYGDDAPKQKVSYFATVMLRTMVKVLGWQMRGSAKRSAFFDPKTRAPKAEPKVLSAEERKALATAATSSASPQPSS